MEITKRLLKTRLWFGNGTVLKWLRHPHPQPCLALSLVISLHHRLRVAQKIKKPEKIWQLARGGLGENHAYSERCVCGCILSKTLKLYYIFSHTCAVQNLCVLFIHLTNIYWLPTLWQTPPKGTWDTSINEADTVVGRENEPYHHTAC